MSNKSARPRPRDTSSSLIGISFFNYLPNSSWIDAGYHCQQTSTGNRKIYIDIYTVSVVIAQQVIGINLKYFRIACRIWLLSSAGAHERSVLLC